MGPGKIMETDLTVIGSGMAGMAAALFAGNRGLAVAQVSGTSPLALASGCLDLLGVHPPQAKREWTDPWEAIEALGIDLPDHPLARIGEKDILASLEEFFSFLEKNDLPYDREPRRNWEILTPLGTVKRTYGVPKNMTPGDRAWVRKADCLLVEIRGLKGFSAGLIRERLKEVWPGLQVAVIDFPGFENRRDLLPEQLAQRLTLPVYWDRLTELIRRHSRGFEVVGLPAVLGLYRSRALVSEMEEKIGMPLFEIPTLPPSVPGLRLKEAFDRGLAEMGVHPLTLSRVVEVISEGARGFRIRIQKGGEEQWLHSRGILLAGGRFLGGGLKAERQGIREPLFDLPVVQPKDRQDWHRLDFFDPKGHPVNRAGLETDDCFRPLNGQGEPAYENLFAAGSILAHQDWVREKCGGALSVATAWVAVKSFAQNHGG